MPSFRIERGVIRNEFEREGLIDGDAVEELLYGLRDRHPSAAIVLRFISVSIWT